MNTDYLREFTLLAQYASFSKAARALHISQPALSNHIAALEKEAGAILVDRSRQDISLTPLGRAWLPEVNAAFARSRRWVGRTAVSVLDWGVGGRKVVNRMKAATMLQWRPPLKRRALHYLSGKVPRSESRNLFRVTRLEPSGFGALAHELVHFHVRNVELAYFVTASACGATI